MATYTGSEHSAEVVNAGLFWRERCLENSRSVFSDNGLWTATNFDGLKRAFVDHPLLGPEKFIDKLVKQLESASVEVKQLTAESLWLLYLFVGRAQFGENLKRERIQQIWQLSGKPLPKSKYLNDEALEGLAHPGAAFQTKIPNELEYLVTLLSAWKALDTGDRLGLLGDPWRMSDWVARQQGSGSRAFRHMFLYFNFPDYFERICSWRHKRKILESFGAEAPADASSSSETAIDKAIYSLRKRLENEYQTVELDFYRPPLRERWLKASEPLDSVELQSSTQVWIEKTLVKGRPDRLEGDNAMGRALWSPQRSKAGGDIYATMRRVKPGDVVFHLTDNQAITHVSIAESSVDDSFVGIAGTEWGDKPSYRIPLRDTRELTPPLRREEFLETQPFATDLKKLLEAGAKGIFYNAELTLNQGAYLTEASPTLIGILDAAYRQASGQGLPYVDVVNEGSPDKEPFNNAQPWSAEETLGELFLDADEIETILTLWQAKKNIILQGPPGVGKSFAAQRLAYLLMKEKAKDRIGFVQFHQSYSYEDFVQGYRPNKEGFDLRNGKFVDFCRLAGSNPSRRYVFIIDEINRGNLSKILGELMLLIESDKRDSTWEMPLAYSNELFHVPSNVYLIGLMNTADRSLAVVDYALRRRFAFIDLVPKLESDKFRSSLKAAGLSDQIVDLVRERLTPLNIAIIEDVASLGPGFAIGHSFFCAVPAHGEDGLAWYSRIVRTELLPLLREYWFDASGKVKEWEDRLLADL